MPTYEYSCDACGHGFEKEQRITEKPIRKCPECGKLEARRLIGSGNFILKGSGWYSDLYSGPSNRQAENKSDSNGQSSDGQSSDTAESSGDKSNGKGESKESSKSESSSSSKSSSAAD